MSYAYFTSLNILNISIIKPFSTFVNKLYSQKHEPDCREYAFGSFDIKYDVLFNEEIFMKYTNRLTKNEKLSMIIPFFSMEKTEEESYIRRMNSFYSELSSSIVAYAQCDDFPKGARYFAKAEVSPHKKGICVHLDLRLRKDGQTLKSTEISHVWDKGVIVEKI